ncbi:MAG TPA: ABC transporter substrate-binding protein [Solirubrobacterales bacterium]|nr:ABC transporter substrate-binding protein [Solirubrobacterales bacterium]
MRQSILGMTCRGMLALIAVCAMLVGGCGGSGGGSSTGGKPTEGGTLRLAMTGEPTNLNPQQAIDQPAIYTVSQINEPLFRTDADSQVVPWLLKSATHSADGLTWTLKLRPGVKFSNGQPLTAEDVVFSIDAVRESVNWSFMYEAIDSVRAVSPTTVELSLSEPMAALESALSLYASGVVPAGYAGMSPKQFAQRPIGTGPFVLEKWSKGRSLTLARNADYWQPGKPFLDKVVISSVPDDNSRVAQLRGGQLDVVATPPWSQLDGLRSTPGLRVGEYSLARADYVMLNLAEPLFEDPRVREAASLALDRSGVVEAALAGNGKVGGSWLPEALLYADHGIKPPTRDVAKAKRLLSEAVAERGLSPALTLILTAGDTYAQTAGQIVQQDLEEVGFKVELQPLDEAAILSQLAAGEYQAAILALQSDIVDPSELVSFYTATGSYYTGAPTEAVGKLGAEGAAALDDEKRRQIYAEIQRQVGDENNLLTMDYQPFVWAMNDKVAGFEINATGIPWLADTGFNE